MTIVSHIVIALLLLASCKKETKWSLSDVTHKSEGTYTGMLACLDSGQYVDNQNVTVTVTYAGDGALKISCTPQFFYTSVLVFTGDIDKGIYEYTGGLALMMRVNNDFKHIEFVVGSTTQCRIPGVKQ